MEAWVLRALEYSHIFLFYVNNLDILSLFGDSPFSFLANLKLCCIDALYHFFLLEENEIHKRGKLCNSLSKHPKSVNK